MTDTVRFAQREDAGSIIACLRLMHEENGLFSLSEDRIREIIESAINPPQELLTPPLIGVIGSVGDVEATICLMLTRLYYTDEWHLGDLWNFIRPDCRKKNHIELLVKFAKDCTAKSKVPLMSAVVSNKRTEAKVRIFSRHYGKPLGAFFLYRPGTT